MRKKAVIEILLIQKAVEQANEEIEKQILSFFRSIRRRFLGLKGLRRLRLARFS